MTMGALELALAGGFVSAIVWGLARLNAAQERRLYAGWVEAARIVKGKVASDKRRLWATLDGVELEADEVRHGKAATTQIRAGISGTIGLELHVKRAGVIDALGQTFTANDATGDAAFDSDFATDASNRELARLWLDAPVRAAIRASGEWTFALKRGTLTLSVGYLVSDGSRLARALRSAAAFARRGGEIEREWAELARVLGGVVTKAFKVGHAELGAMTLERERIETRLSIRQTAKGALTAISASAPPKVDGTLVEELEHRARDTLGATLAIEGGRISVEAPRIVFARKELEAMLALVTEAAATPSLVPYR